MDIAISNPPDATVDALAARAAAFYRSLNASFDLSFAEFSDRDAAFKQYRLRRRRHLLVGRRGLPPQRPVPETVFVDVAHAAGDVADPARQHPDAVAEQRLGPLPGQSRRVAARRGRPAPISRPTVTPASSRSCSAAAPAA